MLAILLLSSLSVTAWAEEAAFNSIISKKPVDKEHESSMEEGEPETELVEMIEEEAEEAEEAEEETEVETEEEAEESPQLDMKGNEQEKGEEKEKTIFDQRLAGAWELFYEKRPDTGTVGFLYGFRNLYSFFHNGGVYTYVMNYPQLIAQCGEALTISAKNGRMDYFEKLCEFMQEHSELFEDEYILEDIEELSKCSNVEISYSFFDISEKGSGDFKPDKDIRKYYKESKEDGLLIKIEADVQTSPLKKEHQVYEFKYFKNYEAEYRMREWYFLGDWEDSLGNSWNVDAYIADRDSSYVRPECVYTLVDSDGKEFVTKSVYWTEEQDGKFNPQGYVRFAFPGFQSPVYKVESMSYDKIVLSAEGEELVMTRVAEPESTIGKTVPKTY